MLPLYLMPLNGAGKGKAVQVKLGGMGSTTVSHSLRLACIELPACLILFKIEIKHSQDSTPCWAVVYNQHVSDREEDDGQSRISASPEVWLCLASSPLRTVSLWGCFGHAAAPR